MGLLYSFANESAALFARGSFHGGDAPAITISDAGQSVRLARGVDAGGCLQVRKSLAALRRNKSVETEHARGTLTVRPGVRMRKLTVRPER